MKFEKLQTSIQQVQTAKAFVYLWRRRTIALLS
jgi:hypothetical protein